MDSVTLILTALASGALLIAKETASEAIRDVYHGLKKLVQRKVVGKQDAEHVLIRYEQSPESWRTQLESMLTEAAADKDEEIIKTAQKLMALVNPRKAAMGEYDVQIHGSVQEVIAFVVRDGEQHRVPFLVPPRPSYNLIGRDNLLVNLKQQLISGENVALYGLPGVGKTSLAVELAHDSEIRKQFQDGVLWAGLGQKGDVLSHLGTWGALLGIPYHEIAKLPRVGDRARVVRAAIGMRRMLLVIDDVWETKAAQDLKVGGPNCAHLVTTRILEVALEFDGKRAKKVRELTEADGTKLLMQLAPKAIEAEPEKTKSLVQIVGGLPLALILIGKYLRKETHSDQPGRLRRALEQLQEVEKRLQLEHHEGTLEHHPGLPADAPISLMAVIGVSDGVLDDTSQQTLRALSVFPPKPNSFSEEAALAVCTESVETLDTLIDYGLLESRGEGRYMMHQTITDYGRMKLTDETVYDRMAEFFATYAETYKDDYNTLDLEAVNMIVALQAAFDRGMKESLVKGANAFYKFLDARGLYETAQVHLSRALQAAESLDDTVGIVKTLLNLGTLTEKCGDYTQAEEYLQEGLIIARKVEHLEYISALLNNLGLVKIDKGNYTLAEKYLQEGLSIAREIGHRERICQLLNTLGWVAANRGDYTRAEEYLQESLSIAREIGHRKSYCDTMNELGCVAVYRGDYTQAEEYLKEGLSIAREIGHRGYVSDLLNGLGLADANRGDYTRAEEYLQESLSIAREIGHRRSISVPLANLGCVAMNRGDYTRAEEYLQESLSIAREIGHRRWISMPLASLGEIAMNRGDYTQAEEYLQEGLSIAREIGYCLCISDTLSSLGLVAMNRGNHAQAEQYLQESLTIAREIGHRKRISDTLNRWGEFHLKQQKFDSAYAVFFEGLEIGRETDSKESIATALYGLARVAAIRGNIVEAYDQGQESLRIFETMGHKDAAKVKKWLEELPSTSL
ncbi:MAG: tetratricopeptide repeat protein [Theionarchaea archaeon]|nr:tetratricopeptide repeat protein [Theionarchaea archaeon]